MLQFGKTSLPSDLVSYEGRPLVGAHVLQVASVSDTCRPQLGGRKEGKDR